MDSLCFFIILTGVLFLFSHYWNDAYQLEYAEYVTETFFDEAERLQEISAENYESLQNKVLELNGQFVLSLQIKREDIVYYQKDIKNMLETMGKIDLCEGDFLMITVTKREKKRAVLFTTVWW